MKKPRVGDWVEVRSKEEILRTLDKKGRMEGLPFMPQMFQYCGQRFRVFKRAHKTCDWVYTGKSRKLPNGVHLEVRCDGEAYGGCQAACLLYWKEAWLKPVGTPNESAVSGKQQARSSKHSVNSMLPSSLLSGVSSDSPSAPSSLSPLPSPPSVSSCTEADVWAGTRADEQQANDGTRYVCQGTRVPDFTTPLSGWDIRQYVEDYDSGNVTMGRLFGGFVYSVYHRLARRRQLGRPLRWVYDSFQALFGGVPFPRRTGTIPTGQPTPTSSLNLQPGELARVKSYNEVLATLDANGKNRGLAFDAEMVPYCGGIFPVKTRMTKFIDEKTGKLATMKNACILLEGVWCQSRYSNCKMFCPRSIYSWWHEIWLERVLESARKSEGQGTERDARG